MHAALVIGECVITLLTFAYVVITEHAKQGISNYVDAIVPLCSDYAKNTPPRGDYKHIKRNYFFNLYWNTHVDSTGRPTWNYFRSRRAYGRLYQKKVITSILHCARHPAVLLMYIFTYIARECATYSS